MPRSPAEVSERQPQVGRRIEIEHAVHAAIVASRVRAVTVTALLLGTAQDGGIPQMGTSHHPGPDRLVSSLGIVADDGTGVLIDVTPDVRAQVARLEQCPGYRRAGHNVVEHIALTHAHMGHYAGLVQFGREAHNADGVNAWITPRMARFLTANEPWNALVAGGHLELHPGFGPSEVAPGVTIRLVPVPHRAEYTDTVAISINDHLLFLPDIDSWAGWPEAEEELARHEICLVDATFSSLDEVPGRDLSEIPHPLVGDTIRRFAHLAGETRLILTHINHSNPIARPDSPEARAVVDAGFEVAEDFMLFVLPGD